MVNLNWFQLQTFLTYEVSPFPFPPGTWRHHTFGNNTTPPDHLLQWLTSCRDCCALGHAHTFPAPSWMVLERTPPLSSALTLSFKTSRPKTTTTNHTHKYLRVKTIKMTRSGLRRQEVFTPVELTWENVCVLGGGSVSLCPHVTESKHRHQLLTCEQQTVTVNMSHRANTNTEPQTCEHSLHFVSYQHNEQKNFIYTCLFKLNR